MIKQKYHYLLGKDRKQVMDELGDEFNFYPSEVWKYILDRNWLGGKTILILYFKDNKVVELKIKKYYGKT